jgi:hypothetical protein
VKHSVRRCDAPLSQLAAAVGWSITNLVFCSADLWNEIKPSEQQPAAPPSRITQSSEHANAMAHPTYSAEMSGKLPSGFNSPHVSPAGTGVANVQPPSNAGAGGNYHLQPGADVAQDRHAGHPNAGGTGVDFHPQGAHLSRVVKISDIFQLQLPQAGELQRAPAAGGGGADREHAAAAGDALVSAISEAEEVASVFVSDGGAHGGRSATGELARPHGLGLPNALLLAGSAAGEQAGAAAAGTGASAGAYCDVVARLSSVLSAAHGLQHLDISITTVPESAWVRHLPRLLAPFAFSLRSLRLTLPGLSTAEGAALSEVLANPECRLDRFELRTVAGALTAQAALALTEGLRSNTALTAIALARVPAHEAHTVAREAAEAAAAAQRSPLREIVVNEQTFRPSDL